MAILYRLMCEEEFNKVSNSTPFAWNKKCKWFTDNIEFLDRVSDRKFNNSKFKPNRYVHLVKYEIQCTHELIRVSNNELMLYRCKEPLIKVLNVVKLRNWNVT